MTGLVLEGGALRGIFTSGVLDVLMENDIYAPYVIGVSAGATNAMSYKSHQIGRNKLVMHPPKKDSYFGITQTIKCGNLVNLDILFGEYIYNTFPFDFETYFKEPMKIEYVASCLETGETAFLTDDGTEESVLKSAKATCALPMLSKEIEIGGLHYADGSITDSFPARRAMENGCDRVVAILTRPHGNGHATDYTKTKAIIHKLYAKQYPKFYDACMNRMVFYEQSVKYLDELEENGKALVLRPDLPELSKLEKDENTIENYYQHGRDKANAVLDTLREWLVSD